MNSLVRAVASSKSSVDLLDFGLAMMACWEVIYFTNRTVRSLRFQTK